MKKYTFDKDFFSIINEINSYWAGFWAADGCVGNDYQNIITLSYKDHEHLKQFKECAKISKEVRVFEKLTGEVQRKYCSLSIYSKNWKEDLLNNFNITPRKTFTYKPPILPRNLLDHFIIGYIDGDGTITLNKNKKLAISVIGTKETLQVIKKRFDEIIKQTDQNSSCGVITKTRNVYVYRISHNPAIIVAQYLKNICDLKLNRKWSLIELAQQSEHINHYWSEVEQKLLIECYNNGLSITKIKEQYMKHRTIRSIKMKIHYLKLDNIIKNKQKQCKWTEEDEQVLRDNYQNMSCIELQQKFFCDRTVSQVESKISALKLKKRKNAKKP